MSTPHRCSHPATRSALTRAIELTAHCAQTDEAVAMHLASPTSVMIGVQLTCHGDHVWRLRGTSINAGGDPVGAAVDLVKRTRRPDDRFIDLDGDPMGWLKWYRSGGQLVLSGTDVLYEMPRFVADPELPVEAALLAVYEWLVDPRFRPPAVLATPHGPCLLGGEEERIHLASVDGGRFG